MKYLNETKLLLLCALAALAAAYTEEENAEWELFKIAYQKEYDSAEESRRKEIFVTNLNFVREHNKQYESGEVNFTVAINDFSDQTKEEWIKLMSCYSEDKDDLKTGDEFEFDENIELPITVDWRKKGAVTPIRNQKDCGSCYAFSTTGALEGQTFLKTKKLVPLSEQNIVDCSRDWGNAGCRGGNIINSYKYVRDNKGIDTEDSYPYKAKEFTCNYNATTKGASCTGWVSIPRGDEKALRHAVATVGPIAVGIDASSYAFQSYKSGVLYDHECSSVHLNHAVLVVGYGTLKKGGDYWLVKNSWGRNLGSNGYWLMARNNNNMCGIATDASYPKV